MSYRWFFIIFAIGFLLSGSVARTRGKFLPKQSGDRVAVVIAATLVIFVIGWAIWIISRA